VIKTDLLGVEGSGEVCLIVHMLKACLCLLVPGSAREIVCTEFGPIVAHSKLVADFDGHVRDECQYCIFGPFNLHLLGL